MSRYAGIPSLHLSLAEEQPPPPEILAFPLPISAIKAPPLFLIIYSQPLPQPQAVWPADSGLSVRTNRVEGVREPGLFKPE